VIIEELTPGMEIIEDYHHPDAIGMFPIDFFCGLMS
jgi:hypothetical protein